MSIFKKTRLERTVMPEPAQEAVSYPRIQEEEVLLTPIAPVKEEEPAPPIRNSSKTINPYTRPLPKPKNCIIRLTALSKDDESQRDTLVYDENSILLNRHNIDPDNPTLSSKGHALLEVKNGQVFISNQTAAQTTFIQVNSPMPLQSGDVILLGDRLVRIEIETTAQMGLDD